MNRDEAEKLLAALIFDDLDEPSRADLTAYLQTDDELSERLADMRMAVKVTSDALKQGPEPVLDKHRLKSLAKLAGQKRRPPFFTLRYMAAAAAVLVVVILPSFYLFNRSYNYDRSYSQESAKISFQGGTDVDGDVSEEYVFADQYDTLNTHRGIAKESLESQELFARTETSRDELIRRESGSGYTWGIQTKPNNDVNEKKSMDPVDARWDRQAQSGLVKSGKGIKHGEPASIDDTISTTIADGTGKVDVSKFYKQNGKSGDGDAGGWKLVNSPETPVGGPDKLGKMTEDISTDSGGVTYYNSTANGSINIGRQNGTAGGNGVVTTPQKVLSSPEISTNINGDGTIVRGKLSIGNEMTSRESDNRTGRDTKFQDETAAPKITHETTAWSGDGITIDSKDITGPAAGPSSRPSISQSEIRGKRPLVRTVQPPRPSSKSSTSRPASAKPGRLERGYSENTAKYSRELSTAPGPGKWVDEKNRPEGQLREVAKSKSEREESRMSEKFNANEKDERNGRKFAVNAGGLGSGSSTLAEEPLADVSGEKIEDMAKPQKKLNEVTTDTFWLYDNDKSKSSEINDKKNVVDYFAKESVKSNLSKPGGATGVPILGDTPIINRLFQREGKKRIAGADEMGRKNTEVASIDGTPLEIQPGQLGLDIVLGVEDFEESKDVNGDVSGFKVDKVYFEDSHVVKSIAPVDDESNLPLGSHFKRVPVNPWVMTERDQLSTFALDVDTASYTLCRKYIFNGFLPPAGAVRMEEFINYFDYHYPQRVNHTFTVHAEAAASPFAEDGKNLTLLKVGVKARTIGRDQQKPAHLVLVVDTSASMGKPDRLGLVQQALTLLVEKLSDADRVTLITCSNESRLHLEAVSLRHRDKIRQAISDIQPSGHTNLLAGLKLGYAFARRSYDAKGINHIVLCSDGVANVGYTDAEQILKEVAADRKQGITLTCVGVGYGSYNDAFMETLANRGDGSYVFLDSTRQAQRVFVEQLAATMHVVAKDARIQVRFNPQRVRRYRLIGYEDRDIEDKRFRDDTVDAGEVGSGQCSTALYELELTGQRSTAQGEGLGTVFVRYRHAETGRMEEISWGLKNSIVRRRNVANSPGFFLAAAASRFGEILRQSEHAQHGSLKEVLTVAEKVSLALPLDRDVRELVELIRKAEHLPRAE